MSNKLNEGSEFTIPLKNLIGLIAFTGIAVWGYFGIIERLAFLEHDMNMQKIKVESNYEWVNGFQPPPSVQEAVKGVRELEKQLETIKLRIKYLEGSVYK